MVDYRGHVTVLGHSKAVTTRFIRKLLDESRFEFKFNRDVETLLVESKFNKDTQETKEWKESTRHRTKVVDKFRNAALTYIRSVQRSHQTREGIEASQISHFSSAATSVQGKFSLPQMKAFNLSRTLFEQKQKSGDKPEQTGEKHQNPKLDNATLLFLYRNMERSETPDDYISYSINLWAFADSDNFFHMNHLFLKAESLILFVMDISLDIFSPLEKTENPVFQRIIFLF